MMLSNCDESPPSPAFSAPEAPKESVFCLSDCLVGQTVCVNRIETTEVQLQALQFGILPASQFLIQAKLPAGGPLVLRMGPMEVALGRALCDHIFVQPQPERR
ncbi:MAG: FeoA family protein [Candidatus Melainabacteria bacterium]|nr:FeoA family protein [Candidatus Melainabacteria bacterium]